MQTSTAIFQDQLIEAPASDSSRDYETLGYLEAYDAVLNCDYAFVAYKETEKSSHAWRVCIRSKQTVGSNLDPVAIRRKARETAARGKTYFTWGYSFAPSIGDPRQIEFRVHVANGEPRDVEIFARARKADYSADEPKSVTFAWPQF